MPLGESVDRGNCIARTPLLTVRGLPSYVVLQDSASFCNRDEAERKGGEGFTWRWSKRRCTGDSGSGDCTLINRSKDVDKYQEISAHIAHRLFDIGWLCAYGVIWFRFCKHHSFQYGRTALMHASLENNEHVVRQLLRAKASTQLKDNVSR